MENVEKYGKNHLTIWGGHLFAIAAEKTLEIDPDGWMYGFAKNKALIKHYEEEFGAKHQPFMHPYQIIVDTPALHDLLDKYNYEWR